MVTDINPPDREPVTLEAAKLFLRIDHAHEDTLIADLIRSAREQLETLCRSAMISRAQRLTLTAPFQRCLYLNVSPLSSVTALTLHYGDGSEQNVELGSLCLNLRSVPASITAKPTGHTIWQGRPDITAITVDVISGYGPEITDVPMPLRQAMMLLIGQGYEMRSGREMPSIPLMVDALIMPYRSLKL